jgi:hypothetical protein
LRLVQSYCKQAMAVASPYAVFRAVDLGWPLAMPAIREPAPAPAPNASAPAGIGTPRKRSSTGLRRRTAPQWNTLIQGELFPA